MKHKETHLTQAQLIEKLAQNRIDVKTFKRLSASCKSEELSYLFNLPNR